MEPTCIAKAKPCPTFCSDNETECETKDQRICVPKMIGNCTGYCPAVCPDNQVPCPGPIDSDGCSTQDTCINKNETCPIFCYSHDEMLCEIEGQTICVPKRIGNCSGYCPVICKANEIPCPGHAMHGCPTQDICMANIDKCPCQDTKCGY